MIMQIRGLSNATIWRMMQWLVLANVLYVIAFLPYIEWKWPPQVQTGLLAAANCALGAWIAFRIDSGAFKKVDAWKEKPDYVTAGRVIAKSLILAAGMLATNLKLG